MPVPSQNPYGGIFQYVVTPQGSDAQIREAQKRLAAATPETMALFQALNVLPEGELKSWLMANPIQFWKKIIALFKGRKYTTGQYLLGERYIDQVTGGNVGRKDVPDDMVPVAQTMLTILFGVRLTTNEDLDALELGPTAYYNRGAKGDIPYDAVERAVYLKQHFYPNSTYNNIAWDLKYFEVYPLVAPILGLDEWTLYNGELPGGAIAVNGLIPVSAQSILQQYPNADFDPVTGNITTEDGEVIAPGRSTISEALSSPGGIMLLAAGAFLLLMGGEQQ